MISKDELRARMRVTRRRLAAEAPDASLHLAEHLPQALPAGRAYGLYHPIGSEIDPREIRLPGDIALPVALARNAALVFRRYAPGDPLVADAFGILAPTTAAPEVAPDIVFTPVLAFDRRGGRLGQGAGCYDRTIAGLRAQKPVVIIGVAYAGQELPEAPMEPHDERLDAILTETGYIQVS
ncbi:5-formyltetrahydrofolate cyclo-ligase [Phenylobacterium sp.]|uniref:5-formyltetrahydrofolate cyclo-ligase n=1 Tax=Phenylobacterium sp. TaxID=1871053 RepID=UPI0025EADC92|nr:5-formyltetrahydrofolate cyclo-ligase [Phenylobacterium sp.]